MVLFNTCFVVHYRPSECTKISFEQRLHLYLKQEVGNVQSVTICVISGHHAPSNLSRPQSAYSRTSITQTAR